MGRLARLAALAGLAFAGPVAAATVDVIPRPLSVEAGTGTSVRIDSSTRIATPPGDRAAATTGTYLVSLMRRTGLPSFATASRPGGSEIMLVRTVVRGGPEAYRLDIGGGRATISAATDAGLRYGAVTLWQLATAAAQPPRGPVMLAPMRIADAPRFGWRGLLLDSARHFQSVAFIERMLDWMALHKLNVLQWHLTDDQGWRLQIAHYPRLTSVGAWRTNPDGTRYGGFYTQAEVRRLVAHAAARGITIVPEIEMPGHALSAILAYPDIGFAGVGAQAQGDWGVFPSIYGVDDHTFGFLQTVLGEVMSLFPSPYIAIGGDEAVKDQWHKSAAVQARMKALGIADEAALQAYFVRRIGTFLNTHHRRLIGWDEILAGGNLPTGDAVLSWHGAEGAVAAAHSGHDVVMATAPTLYFDNRQSHLATEPPGRGTVVSLHDVYAYDPGDPPLTPTAPTRLTAADARHVLGLQANLWTEHIATEARVEQMGLPRAAAVAESGWTSAGQRDWPGFLARLPAQFARYRALGLAADEGAIGIAIEGRRDGDAVAVTLTNQVGLGDIRYTTDGSDPSPGSSTYKTPLMLPLPTHLRAATYSGRSRVSTVTMRDFDASSLRHRVSQELRLCSEQVALNLEGRATGEGSAPVMLVDVKNPCWIYANADLGDIASIGAGVAALPFNYQFGDEATSIRRPTPTTAAGELVVRLDGCTGPVIATLPLGKAAAGGHVTPLAAPLASPGGVHDLCLQFTARQLDPLWALAWVQLEPAAAK